MTKAHQAPKSGAVPEHSEKRFAALEAAEIIRQIKILSKKEQKTLRILSKNESFFQPESPQRTIPLSRNVRKYLEKKRVALHATTEVIALFRKDLKRITEELNAY